MKTLYLFIIGIIITGTIQAQITLNSNTSTPDIGQSFTYISVLSPSLNVSQSGANQTWDLSSISGTPADFNYIDPSTATESGSFPAASLVEAIATTETYYSRSSSEYTIEGRLIPGSQRETYATDKREILKFPLGYNDVYNETFAGLLENLSTLQTMDRSGTTKIEADGYGSLILPYGTINNVLRVKTIQEYTDYYFGNPFVTYNDTMYFWYNATTKNYIASHTTSYVNGMPYISNATYIDQGGLVTSIDETKTIEKTISFYPNPANDYITINNNGQSVAINIIDVTGKSIMDLNVENGEQLIGLSNLSKGIYFLRYTQNSQAYTEKLIIR